MMFLLNYSDGTSKTKNEIEARHNEKKKNEKCRNKAQQAAEEQQRVSAKQAEEQQRIMSAGASRSRSERSQCSTSCSPLLLKQMVQNTLMPTGTD